MECGAFDRSTSRIERRPWTSGTPGTQVNSNQPGGRRTHGWVLPISISLSNRPGRRSAGSIAFGRFVVPITTTLPASAESSMPSRMVSSVATTRFSTSPPAESSRRGTRASTSSRITMQGLFSFASVNTSRSFDSVSPWYAEESSGPLITSTDDFVDAAIARAR